jgi:hypothetical protein
VLVAKGKLITLSCMFRVFYRLALISKHFLINEVIMLHFKSKKMILPLYFCLLSALLSPALTQAELGGSGSTAARDVAAQRAAKEIKLEKKKKDAEAKKAAEAQQGQPAETQQPAEGQQEKPAAK